MLEYKGLTEIDLRLNLLSGSEMKVENLVIQPYTLKEITSYGYTNYMKNLQWISVGIDDFISSVDEKGKQQILEEQRANLKTFDFYVKFGGDELFITLVNILMMVFKTEDVRILGKGVLAIDFVKKGVIKKDEQGNFVVDSDALDNLPEDEITIVHRDNFDDIAEVVQLQNYLKKPVDKKDETNPVDDETRKLMEDMERNRKRVEAKKQAQKEVEKNNDEPIDISDIISAISSKSNSINKLNIWDFTLYQIYDEYSRLELIDNYDFSIRAIMAGAEKIELKHWSSKL